MTQETSYVVIDDWTTIRREFRRFFAAFGTVTDSDEMVAFASSDPGVDTGITLTRDGRASAFMPLHGLDARWHQITFDHDAAEARLEADGVTYVYRIPGSLRNR